jgi:L-histidine Nalpha-methyltransferase
VGFAFVDLSVDRDDLRDDVLTGLASSPKSIPPKYFYDDAGCRLFEAICAQPEYAVCRTEQSLMAAHMPDIAAAIGPVEGIVEPGAGDCVKVRRCSTRCSPRISS